MMINKPTKLLSEINVTPFVDIMLVLLIVFMVSAPMMKEGMKVDLPEADSRAIEGESQDLTITINKDKTLDINGSPIDVSRLEMILGQIKQQRQINNVFLAIPCFAVFQLSQLAKRMSQNGS